MSGHDVGMHREFGTKDHFSENATKLSFIDRAEVFLAWKEEPSKVGVGMHIEDKDSIVP